MNGLHYEVKYTQAFPPKAVVSDDTAQVSNILDTANFNVNELVLVTGTLTDANATFTLKLEEGDTANLADAADVADADMLGTEAGASFQYDDDNETRKLGYIGSKRYIRATVTPSGNTGDLYMAGVWAQAGARKSPQS